MNANKNIIDLIANCNYNNSYKDYIMKILIELSSHKNAVFFKTVLPNTQNKIIAIKYPLMVKLKGNGYEVKLTIYIISDFPEKAPEVFIDNGGDPLLAVNPKNQNVNPENFKVMTPKMYSWTKITSIQEILTEVINSFEANFPIYKKKPNASAPQSHINNNSSGNFNANSSGNNNNANQRHSVQNDHNNNMGNINNNMNSNNWGKVNINNVVDKNKGCPPISTNCNTNVIYPQNNNNQNSSMSNNQNFNRASVNYPNDSQNNFNISNNNNNIGNNTQNKNSNSLII